MAQQSNTGAHIEHALDDDSRAAAGRWRQALHAGGYQPLTALVLTPPDWPGRLFILHEDQLPALAQLADTIGATVTRPA